MIPRKNSQKQAQVIYFSHGGGPLPILGEPSHQAMVQFMEQLPLRLRTPDAILVISAHWEEELATLSGSAAPPMIFDYYGFPDAAYEITYAAPGSPELAQRIVTLLNKNNIPATIDPHRGIDHGAFIPLKLIYPQADIPTLQLSLLHSLDPRAHITLGNALQELMVDNILVIGSGFTFHNMKEFSMQGSNEVDPANDAFQNWLINVCTGPLSQSERERSLIEWQKAPSARYCHPREEHLLPLHVCLGMANKQAATAFDDYILNKRGLAFLW